MFESLQLAVNHALNEYSIARSRMALVHQNHMGLDAKRASAWCEYGFKDNLVFNDLYKLYRRGGLAHGAVNKLISNVWKSNPWVIEGDAQDESREETQWERGLKPLTNAKFWRAIREADRRRLVGRYSALLLRVRDSKAWDQPVDRSSKLLMEVIPVWEGAITVSEYHTDMKLENYGLPKMWLYQETQTNGRPGEIRSIHPDRVFILGDYANDAIGFLEPAYNAFVSLEKVEGGSGESFLKNASRQISVNFDKDVDLQNIASAYGVSLDELQTKFNEAAREINRGNDQMLITQGASVSPLTANIPDPTPTYDVNLQTVSAALDIPAKILVGMQTGERASQEDQKYFNSRCQSYRNGDLSFEISELFAQLIRIGIVKDKPEFTVMWDDLTEPTLGDKLANAKLMSDINAVSLAIGEAIYDRNEIRTTSGFDPDEEAEPLPDVDDDLDDEV